MARANSTPPIFRRPLSDFSGAAAHDYRLLVEAVQEDDLTAARAAYGRMMERFTAAGTGSEDALARIGAGLRRGDLETVQRTLDGLEGKALQVLRGLRDRADLLPPDLGGGPPLRKPN